jgi:hypothetical protein
LIFFWFASILRERCKVSGSSASRTASAKQRIAHPILPSNNVARWPIAAARISFIAFSQIRAFGLHKFYLEFLPEKYGNSDD